MLGNGAVLLLEWQFNSPVILSFYVSVTVTRIWKKLWFDARVRGVCLPKEFWNCCTTSSLLITKAITVLQNNPCSLLPVTPISVFSVLDCAQINILQTL